MMTVVTGGSGSGKSAFAEDKIVSFGPAKRIYIATMHPYDEESHKRVARHRKMRAGKGFETVECYTGLKNLDFPENAVVLLECMSNLAANEMFEEKGAGEKTVEAVLEGMSEYYSKNLAREVMKGMNETALQCKHTGGCPPLGYDLDENRQLVINEWEAQAVKIIFQMFADGYGYSEIIERLNAHGYKTKRGKMFGKNSLYEILSNEKYTGVFVFNKAAARADGKRNNHTQKDNYIRIDGGCPAIVGKKLFAQVQQIKAKNKRNAGRYHSKEFYLLTGKLVCDVCGKRMIGNLRFSGRSKTRLATYRCNTHRSACNNKELNKDYLDAYIAVLIGERLKPKNLRKTVSKVNQQVQKFNSSYDKYHTDVLQQYAKVQDSLANITRAIEKGIFTDDLLQRAEQLEDEKAKLETRLHELKLLELLQYEDVAYLHTQWKELKRNTEEFRTFIQQFVKEIHVRPYDFDIVLDVGFGVVELTETIPMRRGELYEIFDSKVKE